MLRQTLHGCTLAPGVALASLSLWRLCAFWPHFLKELLAPETDFSQLLEQLQPTLPEANKDVCRNPNSLGRCQEVTQGRPAVYRPGTLERFSSGVVVWIVMRKRLLPGKRGQAAGSHSENHLRHVWPQASGGPRKKTIMKEGQK